MSKDNMDYIESGKKTNKNTATNAAEHEMRGFSLKKFLWVKTKQHKLFLISTYAIVGTIFWLMPFLPGEIVHFVSGLF